MGKSSDGVVTIIYPNLAGIKERAIVTGERGDISFNYSNPEGRTGRIQNVRNEGDLRALFDRIFQLQGTKPTAEPRKPIVDRVIENYRSMRQSNKRMGAADRQRLDDQMARLAELQRDLNVTVPVACNSVTQPADDTNKVGSRSRIFPKLNVDISFTTTSSRRHLCAAHRASPWSA